MAEALLRHRLGAGRHRRSRSLGRPALRRTSRRRTARSTRWPSETSTCPATAAASLHRRAARRGRPRPRHGAHARSARRSCSTATASAVPSPSRSSCAGPRPSGPRGEEPFADWLGRVGRRADAPSTCSATTRADEVARPHRPLRPRSTDRTADELSEADRPDAGDGLVRTRAGAPPPKPTAVSVHADRHRLRPRRLRPQGAPRRHARPTWATRSSTSAPTARSRSTTRRSARRSAARSSRGDAERGIVLGGSGQGEQIAANKVPGVRAALCNDLYTARLSREHNDANVLSMGGRIVGVRPGRRDPRALARHAVRGRPPPAAASTRSPSSSDRASQPPDDAERTRMSAEPPWPAHRRRHRAVRASSTREVERQNTTIQLIASRELHLARRCWRPPARCSPTSTPRATPASATTAATRSSTRSRTSPATRVEGAVRRRARQRAAPLGRQRQHGRLPRAARAGRHRARACASTRAATSPTARRSTSAAASTTSSPTA